MMSQRLDVHQHITDRIIAAIELGAGAFKLLWHRPARSIAQPANIGSGKGYRGINVVSLWVVYRGPSSRAKRCRCGASTSRWPSPAGPQQKKAEVAVVTSVSGMFWPEA